MKRVKSIHLFVGLLIMIVMLYAFNQRDRYVLYYFPYIDQYGKLTTNKGKIYLSFSESINYLSYRKIPPKTVDYITVPDYDCLFVECFFINTKKCDTLYCTGDYNSIRIPIINVSQYSNPLKGVFWQDRFTTGNTPKAGFLRIRFNTDESGHLILEASEEEAILEIRRKNM